MRRRRGLRSIDQPRTVVCIHTASARGVGTLRTLALSSTLLTLDGGGSVNLGEETLALHLRPQARIGGTGLMESLVPADSLTEGFAWLTAATGLGIAIGSSLAGPLIDAYGPSRALLLTTAATVTATLLAVAGRGWLPASAPARS